MHLSTCTIEVGSPNTTFPPNHFIEIRSSEFKRFECKVKGADREYDFEYGNKVSVSDYFSETGSSLDYGLLFDANGEPLRFDSPQIAGQSYAGIGFWDSPEQGFFGFDDDTHLGFTINDNYQTPAAVLLKPTAIGGVVHDKGYITSISLLPDGSQALLLNGNFTFTEQMLYEIDDQGPLAGERIPNRVIYRNGFYSFRNKLTVPKVRITQSVFDESGRVIDLVHQRTTAIILDKETESFYTLTITDITEGHDNSHIVFQTDESDKRTAKPSKPQTIFYCDETINYCNLKQDHTYAISVDSADGLVSIYNEVNVKETNMLELYFFGILNLSCIDNFNCGFDSVIEKQVGKANEFILRVLPLADSGLKLVPLPLKDSIGDSFRGQLIGNELGEVAFDIAAIHSAEDSIRADIRMIERKRAKSGTLFQRGIGFVSNNYFEEKSALGASLPPRVQGVYYSGKAAIVELDVAPVGVAHEIGHSFGLALPNGEGEEYDRAPNGIGFPAEGFDVYNNKIPLFKKLDDTYNYMAASGLDDEQYWVNKSTWESTFYKLASNTKTVTTAKRLSNNIDSPALIYVSFDLYKNGHTQLYSWIETSGISDLSEVGDAEVGDYSLEVLSKEQDVILNYEFNADFRLIAEPIGAVPVDVIPLSVLINYPLNSYSLRLKDKSGKIIFNEDPLTMTISTFTSMLAGLCDYNEYVDLQSLRNEIKKGILNRNYLAARDSLLVLHDKISSNGELTCSSASHYDSLSDVLQFIERLISRVEFRYSELSILDGDFDQDGDVDRNDLNILLASRNQLVGEYDPKDLDEDGRITGLDARKLTQLCTRPRCAVE